MKKQKSAKRFLKHPALKHSRFSIINLAAFILVFAGIGGYILLRGQAISETANLWISTTGSASCSRSTSPVDYATAITNGNVCDTGPDAYKLAQLGDTILMQGGTYTTAWIFLPAITKTGPAGTCDFNYPNLPNLSNCITFRPATGQNVTFAVPQTAPTNQMKICSDFIAIDGITFNDQTYVQASGETVSASAIAIGAGDSTCNPAGDAPHDLYMHNLTLGGYVNIVGGAYNAWVNDSTFTGTHDIVGNFGGGGSYVSDCVHNSGYIGNTFQDYNFVNHGYSDHHMAILHTTGCTPTVPNHDLYIAGNRFEGDCIDGSGNPGHCPESYEVETSFKHIVVENNYFDGAPGLTLTCNSSSACVNDNNIVRFNTFNGTGLALQNECASSSHPPPCTGSMDANQFYGNIISGCPGLYSSFDNSTGTTTQMDGESGTGWASRYNIIAGTQKLFCTGDTTSAYSTTVNFVSAGAPNYNLDLTANQKAIDFVPASVSGGCLTTDINGTPRPQGTACDAGADEYTTGGGTTPSPTLSLSAAPASITSGASSTLSWSSTNASSCTASNGWSGSKSTTGSQSVSPTSTTTYTLSCSGTGGSTSQSATVTVSTSTPAPPNPPTPPSPPSNPPSTPSPTLKGDCDGDGHVTILDLSILLSHYGTNYSKADFNGSGKVDLIDLSSLLSDYGN